MTPLTPNQQSLITTANQLLSNNRGILAADESLDTIGSRFKDAGIANTVENRAAYRGLLAATAPRMSEYVGGVILHDETFAQCLDDGTRIVSVLSDAGIMPGIKVDQGTERLNDEDERITRGLDTLNARCEAYARDGARFAKWRAVFRVSAATPSRSAVQHNAGALARYAYTCQTHNLVPIVEPEILIDGDHTLARAEHASRQVLSEVFRALNEQQVLLQAVILKPSMVLPGLQARDTSSAEEIAEATVRVMMDTVPASVPGIAFLSGGLSEEKATEYLNAINKTPGAKPWRLSFSYGRALQKSVLAVWKGKKENVAQAQKRLVELAERNALATQGRAL